MRGVRWGLKKLNNFLSAKSIVRSAIEKFSLDLEGLNVLTEVGSGAFVVTPIIAAMAGSKHVYAVTKDSPYGCADEVLAYGRQFAEFCGVEDWISFSSAPSLDYAPSADIITNLGFVRPLSGEMISVMKGTAVIPLMWEPWEFRSDDLDLASCRKYGIPVIGTCETDARLRTFEYVGMLALKLLLEREVTVLGCNILVVGSDPFGQAVRQKLAAVGAIVALHSGNSETLHGVSLAGYDAVVVVENRLARKIVSDSGPIHPVDVKTVGVELIHICGVLDYESIDAAGVYVYPERRVSHGYMTLTTDYVGARPVIDLHAAGLKVGEIAARTRLAGGSVADAERACVDFGVGLELL